MQKKLLLLGSVLLFISCSPFKTIQVLNDEYNTPTKNYDTSITLLPFTDKIVTEETLNNYLVNNPAERSLISQTNRDIFNNYFGLTFSETTTGEVKNLVGADQLSFVDELDFIDTSLTLDKKKNLSLLIPEKGKLFQTDNPTDYSLLIQSIVWETTAVEEQTKPVGGNIVQRIEFKLRLSYALWDNRKEALAGYGLINEKRYLISLPDRIFYIQFFEEISRMIVRKSPLQERYR